MEATSPEAQAELTRRHKAASTTVVGLLVATILLSVIAFLGRPYFREQPPNPPLDIAVRIVILVLGLGAIAWRRNKFATMRLQDIVGLQGVTGLLKTLEKTTIQLALLGSSITAVGFIATLVTGNEWYTYWAGLIAIVVFIYCYPTKSSWLRALTKFTDPQTPPATEPPPNPV